MFGVHTDKAEAGHIHAHAIVTVRNAEGQKIHPGPEDFRGWRETFAERAQENSLKIVATSAADRASSQSYGPKDKAIVDAAERPRAGREARDRAYSSDPVNHCACTAASPAMVCPDAILDKPTVARIVSTHGALTYLRRSTYGQRHQPRTVQSQNLWLSSPAYEMRKE